MANLKPTAQTGALTLVLLVKMYRSQMIALLVKNGIVVNDNASDEQITSLMTNLLKVSKSFSEDLNNFITNPAVAEALMGGMEQTAQYFQMSGSGYMNSTGGADGFTDTGEPAPADPALPAPTKRGFFSDLNLGDLLTKGIGLFGEYSKGKSDAEIAKAHATVATAGLGAGTGTGTGTGTGSNDGADTGMSTTTIVVLSFVGVALLGTVIYLIARPKN